MKGLQRVARRALLTKLKNDAGLLDLVAKASIDPVGQPRWPFVTLESPVTQRLRMTCVDGGTVSLDVHAFAGGRYEGEALAEDARDHAGRIGEAIERAFDDQWLALDGDVQMRIRLSDIRLLPDDEPESYHWFAQVNCRVLAPA
jgi:hypothetical protein